MLRAVVLMAFMAISLLVSLASHAEPSQQRVFILAGQSNMMGRGQTDKLPEHLQKPPDNVSFYTHGRQSELGKYDYFGPEIQFAHAMSKTFPHDKIILIKSVAGGSSIAEWMPGKALYDGLIRQVNFVIDPKQTSIEAFLWMQGETDARQQTFAINYQHNLAQLIQNLRKDLHNEQLPFLIGQINQKGEHFPMEEMIREAQSSVEPDNPDTIIISTDGLEKIYDEVHFNAQGLVELGKRFAIGFINRRRDIMLDANKTKS